MSILFSPIGTADPLTQLGDGPMLHIVRCRRPSRVVLFLSPAMAGHQHEDGRYTEAIRLLADSEGFESPEVLLVESQFDEVYRFDHYIVEFEQILEGLVAESGKEPVLVNVTSGTPAMEQALVALGAFGRLNLKLLQVTTPKKGVNARFDREDPNDYDLETLWLCNEEIWAASPEERIVEVATPNFADRLLRENVAALVKCFEYEEASQLAGQMRSIDPNAREMIRAAADRLNLNGSLPARVFGGTTLAFKANDLLYEHLYVMEVRLRQGQWGEFLRMLTPALTEIMERMLGPVLPQAHYLVMEKGKPTGQLDCDKVYADSGLRHVLGSKCTPGKTSYITNAMLKDLIVAYCPDDEQRDSILALRRVEQDCRNTLAHELKPAKKESLERLSGMRLEDVMHSLFKLCGKMTPGLYDRINDEILRRL